jgi:O-antigen/teichoic acid export membrane protein
VYKGGSILASFLLVPLTINYLDTENYGIWLTLSSFIAWFSFFDIGLGNGLRNKFAEAKAKGDMTLARGYVSSAYFTIGVVSIGLIVIFTLLNFFIDWTIVFSASPSMQKDLSLLMPIVFGFFCLQLVVKLITTIYTADQHHSMQGKINFFTQAGSLLLIWIMTKTSESSLLVFGVIFSAIPVVILLWFNLFAFNKRYIDFKPSIKLWKKEYLKDIFGLGLKFFVIQISAIILFSTDNFIIAHNINLSEVVNYNLTYKIFSISSMILSLITTPYWSSITDAFFRGELEWIKKSMNSMLKISFILFLTLICFFVFFDNILELWIGNLIHIEKKLQFLILIYFTLSLFLAPFTSFLNGTGNVLIQFYTSIFSAVLNIPLSIYMAQLFGTEGVILATIICMIPNYILGPIQYYKIVNHKASGNWIR